MSDDAADDLQPRRRGRPKGSTDKTKRKATKKTKFRKKTPPRSEKDRAAREKRSQELKGKCFNPAGRPKGSKSFKTLFDQFLDLTGEQIKAKAEDVALGKTTMREGLALQTILRATKDLHAMQFIVNRVDGAQGGVADAPDKEEERLQLDHSDEGLEAAFEKYRPKA